MTNKRYVLASSKPWNKSALVDPIALLGCQVDWVHNPDDLEALVKALPDIRYIFFLHWNWIVPEYIYDRYECVCFHMTDVPYGRGGSPLQNLIARGHTDTVLTALRMVEEVDAGPIYAKQPLSLNGSAEEIYLRASKQSFEMIKWMIESEPNPTAQIGQLVLFKRRKPEQSRLPLIGTLHQIYDHVRMLDAPTYPNAFIDYGEFRIEFTEAALDEGEVTATVRIYKNSNQENL